MPNLIIKSNIKKKLEEIDKEKKITSVSDEVGRELEKKVEDILREGVKRAEANNRKTLMARDL